MTNCCHSCFVIIKNNQKEVENNINEVYAKCPVLENEKYLLRLVEIGDAKDFFNTCGIQALRHMDFKQTKEKLIGHDGMEYENYWICMK